MSTSCPKLYVGTVDSAQRASDPDRKNSTDAWIGERNFGKTICIDVDGVIMDRTLGWQGEDVFGEPIDGASWVIGALRDHGWYVVIFTTRLVTEKLIRWLHHAGIEFDDINGRVGLDKKGKYVRVQRYGRSNVDYRSHHARWFWRHNPEWASIKPIASVYVDDMDWMRGGKQFTLDDWEALYGKLKDWK